MRTLFIVFVFLSTPWLAVAAAGQTDLTEARTQYQEAAYEDALATLTKTSASTPADRVQLEHLFSPLPDRPGAPGGSRACGGVDGRGRSDLRSAIERRLAAVLSMIADIRRKELPLEVPAGFSTPTPGIIQGEEHRPGAAPVRAASQAPRRSGDGGTSRARRFAGAGQGIQHVAGRGAAAGSPAGARRQRQAAGVVHAGLQSRVHARGRDTGGFAGAAPCPIRRSRNSYSGAVKVRIGTDGRVKAVTIDQPSHPAYDANLIRVARTWLYKPASG